MKCFRSALILAASLIELPAAAEPAKASELAQIKPFTVDTYTENSEFARRSSLRMLVLGDSVLWGQGLVEEQKTTRIVQKWLSAHTHRPVTRQVYAHSGAAVNSTRTTPERYHPEVPSSSPSVFDQLLATTVKPDEPDPDLILMNGCANDFGGQYPLGVPDEKLRAAAFDACAYSSGRLLSFALTRFPRAFVVYLGYFPPFTGSSSRPIALSAVGISEALSEATLRKRSIVWHQESNRALISTIGQISRAFPKRAFFAPIFFGAEDGYGRSQAKVFSVTDEDDMAAARKTQCALSSRAQGAGGLIFRVRCEHASIMHPNAAGAAAHANAIFQVLTPLLPRLSN